MYRLRNTLATIAAVAMTATLAIGVAATDEETEPELVGVYSIEGMTWLRTHQRIDGEREVPGS